MASSFTKETLQALRKLMPEIPEHVTKIVLTLEINRPVQVEVTFIPHEEMYEEEDTWYEDAETHH